jgi:hypothetical protein
MGRRIGAILVAIAVAYGCADLGGLSAPASEDGGVDAASKDVDTADTTPTDDAGDAGAPDGFCATHTAAILCDDFSAIASTWQKSADHGDVALTTGTFTSAPTSLLAQTVNDVATETGITAALFVDLTSPLPAKVRYSYNIRFETLSDRAAAIGTVTLRDGTRAYDVYLNARNDGMQMVEDGDLTDGGTFYKEHPFTPIPLGTWTRVIVDLDIESALSTLTLTLQVPPGAAATPALDHEPITPTVASLGARITAGIMFSHDPATTNAWRVEIDDVLLEAR